MASAAVKRWWSLLAEGGCWICQRPAQIAHAHGPSLRERNPAFLKPKGKKMRWGDWLVIPLCPEHHWTMDYQPRLFWREHGSPAELLDEIASFYETDVWGNASALLKQGVTA